MYPSLVLVQLRKTRPCLTERLLMGHKESNQNKSNEHQNEDQEGICMLLTWHQLDNLQFCIQIAVNNVSKLATCQVT